MDVLVNKPNRVLEKQKQIQASTLPVYLRAPRSRLYLGVYLVGWVAGLAGTSAGLYSLIKGKSAT